MPRNFRQTQHLKVRGESFGSSSVTAGLKWPPEIGPNEKISGTNVAPVQFCRFQWGNTLFRVAILEVLPTFGRSFNGLARGAWTAAE